MRIEDIMSRVVSSCSPDDTLATDMVVDAENRLVGMLSLADLAREAAREQGQSQRDLSDREIGDTLAQISQPR